MNSLKIWPLLIIAAFAAQTPRAQILDGLGNLSLEGDQFFVDEKKHTVTIEGNVSLKKDDLRFFSDRMTLIQRDKDDLLILSEGGNRVCSGDWRFSSSLLNFFSEARLLVVKQNARFFANGLFIEADQFTYNLKDRSLNAKTHDRGNVRLIYAKQLLAEIALENQTDATVCAIPALKADDEETYLITANEITWSPDLRTLSLSGNPKVIDHATEANLSADRFEIVLNENNRPITLNAFGNFFIGREDKFSRSEDAEIDLQTRKVFLVNNVKLKVGDSTEIKTDKITLSLDDEGYNFAFPDSKMDLEFQRKQQ